MHCWAMLNVFTLLGDLPLELSLCAKQEHYTHYTISHLPLKHLLSVSVNLKTLGTSHEWNSSGFTFCGWFIPLDIMFSSFIYALRYVKSLFFFLAE
jgi:hypothetical protein